MNRYLCHDCGLEFDECELTSIDEFENDLCPACESICIEKLDIICYECKDCGLEFTSRDITAIDENDNDLCPACCSLNIHKRELKTE